MFHEMDGEVLKVGEIKAVQPDHGTRPVLAVVVPVPGRCEDHVAPLHADAPALYGRKPTLALDDEPHSKGDMSVGLGRLVGHYQLQPAV